MNWRRRFYQPIPLRGGKRIVTLSDARAQLLAIDNPTYPIQVAAGALMQAANGGSLEAADTAFRLALFARLDFKK